MRRVSAKTKRLIEKSRGFRADLVESVGSCELCGTSPLRPKHGLPSLNQLCCHEILNGPLRQKVLMEPSCLIVACWKCNQNELNQKGEWPLARQLAIIKRKAPERYDRERVLLLRNENAPRFVEEHEVDEWVKIDSPQSS